MKVNLLLRCCLVIIGFSLFTTFKSNSSVLTLWLDCSYEIQIENEINSANDCRYLYYYSHSGFSNQLHALQNAAKIAFASNRSLILPPVLPHVGDTPVKFKNWTKRGGGGNCTPFQNQQVLIELAKEDVKLVHNGIAFPSFTELIDFTTITKNTGLQFVDLPSFVQKNKNDVKWSGGKSQIIDYEGRCTLGYRRNFHEMLHLFNKNYGSDQIAVMGSTYSIRNDFKAYDTKTSSIFDRFFLDFPPSKKFLGLLKQWYERLPKGYAGVHIRFPDSFDFECNSSKISNLYSNVFNVLERRNVTDGSTVLIGRSHKKAQKCFNLNANGKFDGVTIIDVMFQHPEIQVLVDDINLEKSTIYAVTDQVLISLANQIVLDSSAFSGKSSYQKTVAFRHLHRKTLLQRLKE